MLFLSFPQNIRRRLLRDIIAILVLTALVIIAISSYQGLTMRRDISMALVQETTTIAQKRFQRFTQPIRATLEIGHSWGRSGLLDRDDELPDLFRPILQTYPQISAVILANEQGQEFFLQRRQDGWLQRDFRAGGNGEQGEASFRQLPARGEERSWQETLQYDPRQRPWFALALAQPGQVQWTEPYLFFSAGQVGVTAAIAWQREDGNSQVLAFDLLQTELLQFFDSLQVGRSGHIVLLEQDGSIIARNQSHDDEQGTPVRQAIQLWQDGLAGPGQPAEFDAGGQHWWVGFSALEGGDRQRAWVLVLVPEKEVMAGVNQRWRWWFAAAVTILLAAVLLAYRLVAKYSYQLRDLPRQHLGEGDSELQALITAGESATLEFKSTLRTNLKTGKTGKEIELAWLKAVVAFMNSDGGILLVGVADDGEILGIGPDNFDNEDRVRLHFKSLISHHIGPEFARFINLKVRLVDEKMVLIIECERVRKPVFLQIGKSEEFLVRSGPSSMKMTMSQMVHYLEDRL